MVQFAPIADGQTPPDVLVSSHMTTSSYPRLVLATIVLLSATALMGAKASPAQSSATTAKNADASADRNEEVTPALPVIPDHQFSLADYKAKGDGKTMNTEAFKNAIAAVNAAGGGTLDVPAGTYLTGAIDFCSSMNLHLEANATILFSPNFDEYKSGASYRPLIQGNNLHDVMISGNGTINGSGEAWWPSAIEFKIQANAAKARSNTSPRPKMVVFNTCQRVLLQDITLTHAPVFNVYISASDDVTADHVTIINPANSPNTDGIDPAVCHHVLISHCNIDTGDDCIAIKSGNDRGLEDVLITDCTFGHGHGCSFGSETNGGDHHVTIRNCTFENTDIGVRLKSDRTRGGQVSDIVYENLTMKNVGQAIVITSYYPDRDIPAIGAHVAAQPVGNKTPQWSNITIRNIVATGCTKNAGMILGLPESLATNITLSNITIDAPSGLRIGYAKDVTLDKVSIKVAKGNPLIIEDTVTGLKQKP